MFIVISKNNRVISTSVNEPIFYGNNILCQVESLPEKYDYLIAENIQLIEEKLGDEVINSYYTCDLVAKFRPAPSPEQLNKIKEKQYSTRVTQLVRVKYDANAVEALLANYAENKEKYQAEFDVFAAYRKQCKEQAHKEVYGE